MHTVGIDRDLVPRVPGARPAIHARSAAAMAVSLVLAGVCTLGSGCQDVQTIWSATARSPDGRWVATARTVQHSGPGTAGIVTSVYLARAHDSGSPEEVLGFFHDVSRTINLTMKWTTPSHLSVTYNEHPDLYFQVVKYGGVEISVQDLSGNI